MLWTEYSWNWSTEQFLNLMKIPTNLFTKYYDEQVDKPTASTNDQTHLSRKYKIKGVNFQPAIHTTYTHILNDHYYKKLLRIPSPTCFVAKTIQCWRRWKNEYGAMVKLYWQGKTKVLYSEENHPTAATMSTTFTHRLGYDWLTPSAMA